MRAQCAALPSAARAWIILFSFAFTSVRERGLGENEREERRQRASERASEREREREIVAISRFRGELPANEKVTSSVLSNFVFVNREMPLKMKSPLSLNAPKNTLRLEGPSRR